MSILLDIGLDVMFTLFRYTATNWFISIVLEGSRPGTQADDYFYCNYYVDSEDPLPPRTGWDSAANGAHPPPASVNPVWLKMCPIILSHLVQFVAIPPISLRLNMRRDQPTDDTI